MPRHRRRRPKAVDHRQRLEQAARIAVNHHSHAVLDKNVAREQDPLARQPDHEITRRVSRAGMGDDDGMAPWCEGIRTGDRDIGRVGKLEAPHCIEADHPDPIGHEGVFPTLQCEYPTVRVSDDFGSQSAEDDGAEMMIWVMVREDQPLDRLGGNRSDRLDQLLPLPRTGQGVDHHHTDRSDDEAGIGPPLRSAAGIAQDYVHIRREPAYRKRRELGTYAPDEGSKSQGLKRGRCGQAAAKLMLTDCLKEAPLLSVQTMVSGPSRSAVRVKLTTGSRLMPEVHSKRATS